MDIIDFGPVFETVGGNVVFCEATKRRAEAFESLQSTIGELESQLTQVREELRQSEERVNELDAELMMIKEGR